MDLFVRGVAVVRRAVAGRLGRRGRHRDGSMTSIPTLFDVDDPNPLGRRLGSPLPIQADVKLQPHLVAPIRMSGLVLPPVTVLGFTSSRRWWWLP